MSENIFSFQSEQEAKAFAENVAKQAKLYLYISIADMKKIKNPLYKIDPDANEFNFGYNKSDVKNVKPEYSKGTDEWIVVYPSCGKITMDEKGLWHAVGVGGE